jgi:hypothetical protein
VPVVGERSLGRGGEQSVGQDGGFFASRYRRKVGALGRLTARYACPTPQPVLEHKRFPDPIEAEIWGESSWPLAKMAKCPD